MFPTIYSEKLRKYEPLVNKWSDSFALPSTDHLSQFWAAQPRLAAFGERLFLAGSTKSPFY